MWTTLSACQTEKLRFWNQDDQLQRERPLVEGRRGMRSCLLRDTGAALHGRHGHGRNLLLLSLRQQRGRSHNPPPVRDREYEQEMIYLEREFWHDYILTRIPPPYTEDAA